MAPGYKSPFDRPLPSHRDGSTPTGAIICPLLAVLLCISIIFALALFAFHTTKNHSSPAQDAQSHPEMAVDQASAAPNYLAVRASRDPRKATNIRDIFIRGESGQVDGGDARPLLPRLAESHCDPLGERQAAIEMATQRDRNVHGKGSINWHGTNMLNTSWGWMA
ncbi:hypothetical protein TARUN_9767 [Trichoderma arundinaceum]|uniref:Uncharacterized protein n=1 Tax=Trichoderma arundinaceum TaxID=490622 RepID=A0A395N9D7_TRIAR|nr:hypothetical protein TARUN_9767 [Trichoderma arundinaceum]